MITETDSAFFQPDAHDIMIREAKIMCLEEENKQMLTELSLTVEALLYYAKQHNGYVAQSILTRIRGGH